MGDRALTPAFHDKLKFLVKRESAFVVTLIGNPCEGIEAADRTDDKFSMNGTKGQMRGSRERASDRAPHSAIRLLSHKSDRTGGLITGKGAPGSTSAPPSLFVGNSRTLFHDFHIGFSTEKDTGQ